MRIHRNAKKEAVGLNLQAAFEGHVHWRSGAMMRAVAPFTVRQFAAGALVMPNLAPQPLTTPELADAYKADIRAVIGLGYPIIMTGYLTEDTEPDTVIRGFQSGSWQAMKGYPRGLTTNSHGGIENFKKLARVFAAMEEAGMPMLFHGESATNSGGDRVDVYDREKVFFDTIAPWVVEKFPGLKISFEHGSTRAFAEFLSERGSTRVVGTLTPQHLMFDRNDFFADGPDVHLHCYPVLKRWEDLEALRALATAGHEFIFAGTDSAPHPTHAKERACGCAGGVFSAHAAVELYAEVFDEEDALPNLEGFLSLNGPRFYGLRPSKKSIALSKRPWTVDSMIAVEGADKVRPLFYHEDSAKRKTINWKLAA